MTCCKSYLESHIRVGRSHLILLKPHFGWLLQFCWFDKINAFFLLRGLGCSRNHQMCYDVLPKSAGFLQNSPGLLLKSPGFVGEPPHFWLVSPPLLSNQTSHIAPCQATHSKGHVHVATVQASTFEVNGIGASEASCPYQRMGRTKRGRQLTIER